MLRMRGLDLTCFIFFSCCLILLGISTSTLATTEGNFTGSWTANGTQESLSFGELGGASLVKLSGHVNLKDGLGKKKDYWSTCIGFVDSKEGSNLRCVWRTLEGQEIYVVLESKKLMKQSLVTGEIIGGTGGAKGVTGSLTLQWSTLSFQTSQGTTAIGGYAKELKGTYQIP